MCGHIEIGEQKDIIITGRDGRQYKPKNTGGGNPGSMLPVVTDAQPNKVQEYRWGLLTLDDDKIHSKNKHARIENLTRVPMWRDLAGKKHCIVRIQAFFEFNQQEQRLYRIERFDGQPFYIAGLWDIWIDIKTNILLPTCAMITMEPNEDMAAIHDRMPAMLERNDVKAWLNSNYTAQQRIDLLREKACPRGVSKITVEKDHKQNK